MIWSARCSAAGSRAEGLCATFAGIDALTSGTGIGTMLTDVSAPTAPDLSRLRRAVRQSVQKRGNVTAGDVPRDADNGVIRSSTDVVKRLCAAARAVAANSYSPYSGYHVGAAIDAAGQTFVGTNVENSTYPASVCAERVALGTAISAGFLEDVTALALYAVATKEDFAQAVLTPCGICLQWLAELTPDIEILVCEGEKVTPFRVSDLLRRPFTS